jgi:hypothetical protein
MISCSVRTKSAFLRGLNTHLRVRPFPRPDPTSQDAKPRVSPGVHPMHLLCKGWVNPRSNPGFGVLRCGLWYQLTLAVLCNATEPEPHHNLMEPDVTPAPILILNRVRYFLNCTRNNFSMHISTVQQFIICRITKNHSLNT